VSSDSRVGESPILELSGVNEPDGAFDDKLCDISFTRDRIIIVDRGKRKTLCRVATGMAGIYQTPTEVATFGDNSGKISVDGKKKVLSVSYSGVEYLELTDCACLRDGHAKLGMKFMNEKERKFGLSIDQCNTAWKKLRSLESRVKPLRIT